MSGAAAAPAQHSVGGPRSSRRAAGDPPRGSLSAVRSSSAERARAERGAQRALLDVAFAHSRDVECFGEGWGGGKTRRGRRWVESVGGCDSEGVG